MGLLDLLGHKRARDKPRNSYEGQDFSYLFGRTTSGENVDEFKAMQTTAVYACVRILAEAVASLPIHVYERTATGKEKKVEHHISKKFPELIKEELDCWDINSKEIKQVYKLASKFIK